MNNINWLLRASLWARHPPSARKVKFVIAIIVIGLLIVGIEKMGLWPEWATMENGRGMRIPRP